MPHCTCIVLARVFGSFYSSLVAFVVDILCSAVELVSLPVYLLDASHFAKCGRPSTHCHAEKVTSSRKEA
eukprot:1985335-Amphidinium_carterae.1